MIDYYVADGICTLRLASPPVNAITFGLLDELRAAIRRAAADAAVRGVVLVGSPTHFSAGADVGILRASESAEDAVRTSCVFQEAFGEVEACPKPVVAAVAGKMMGSAIELAAACHYRVCAAGARFSMPEVTLGINPGAGGCARLPRLVGPDLALRMLLTGSAIQAAEALEAGLVDRVCEADALLDTARDLVAQSEPRRTRERVGKVRDAEANAAAYAAAEALASKGRGELIAPRTIIEAVRAGIDDAFDAGLRAEQAGYADCMATLATRNKLYLFFASRDTAKAPELGDATPSKIATAGVVGMGSMGTGIAHAFLIAGIPVVVRDEEDAALERGAERIRRSIEKRVAQGKMSHDRAEGMFGLLSTTTAWEELADAGVVVEAVFESLATKRAVLGRLEDVCRADAVLATNTSTLSLDSLAEGMRHPERLVGLHFFNPAHRMPLVEVIHREGTAPGVVATALGLAKALRKTPVLVRNREGFLVNRIFIPYFKEAFWLLEEGVEAPAIDAAMVDFGFPMGPLTLIDMAGLDILAHTDRVLRAAFPAHGPLSAIVERLVDDGQLGQKSGAGVYEYEAGSYTPHRSGHAARAIGDVRQGQPRTIGQDEITDRLVLRMVAEAFRVLEEGIVQRESDVDAAMVLGTGFPDFRGGVLKHARDVGLDAIVSRLDELTQRFGERFAPCELLRKQKGIQAWLNAETSQRRAR